MLDLIPCLTQLQALYQAEDFKPLAKFLCECKEDALKELLSLDYSKSEAVIRAAEYKTQINLLGIILNLPTAVKSIKDQQEKIKEIKTKQAADSFDPLNEWEKDILRKESD
jgi:tRNA U34 2-thiouridine synthase MnmA/TrmU